MEVKNSQRLSDAMKGMMMTIDENAKEKLKTMTPYKLKNRRESIIDRTKKDWLKNVEEGKIRRKISN